VEEPEDEEGSANQADSLTLLRHVTI